VTSAPTAALARPLARVAFVLGVISIFTSLVGWGFLALALAGSHDFNDESPKYGFMLLGWVGLGGVAIVAWIAGAVVAVMATARARRTSEPASIARGGLVLAVVIPLAWLIEWFLLVVWFGYEAFSGPWFYLH